MKENAKNESTSAQWRLGAAAKGGSCKIVGGCEFWDNMTSPGKGNRLSIT